MAGQTGRTYQKTQDARLAGEHGTGAWHAVQQAVRQHQDGQVADADQSQAGAVYGAMKAAHHANLRLQAEPLTTFESSLHAMIVEMSGLALEADMAGGAWVPLWNVALIAFGAKSRALSPEKWKKAQQAFRALEARDLVEVRTDWPQQLQVRPVAKAVL